MASIATFQHCKSWGLNKPRVFLIFWRKCQCGWRQEEWIWVSLGSFQGCSVTSSPPRGTASNLDGFAVLGRPCEWMRPAVLEIYLPVICSPRDMDIPSQRHGYPISTRMALLGLYYISEATKALWTPSSCNMAMSHAWRRVTCLMLCSFLVRDDFL